MFVGKAATGTHRRQRTRHPSAHPTPLRHARPPTLSIGSAHRTPRHLKSEPAPCLQGRPHVPPALPHGFALSTLFVGAALVAAHCRSCLRRDGLRSSEKTRTARTCSLRLWKGHTARFMVAVFAAPTGCVSGGFAGPPLSIDSPSFLSWERGRLARIHIRQMTPSLLR